MKKVSICFFVALMTAFFMVSCGFSGEDSEKLDSHRWGRYQYDDINHWRECLDEGCEAVDTEAHMSEYLVCMQIPTCDICGHKYGGPTPHFYDENGTCVRCEEKQHGEGLDYFHGDGYYVVTGIGECPYEAVEISAFHNDLPVTEIGSHAFAENHELTSVVIPDTVKTIGWGAFSGCDSLISVTLPNGLTDVAGYLFNQCQTLMRLDIPNGVAHIGDHAFNHCEALESVTIPASVEKIDGMPFGHCDSLQNIVYKGTKAEWDSITKNDFCIPKNVTVICLDGEIVAH
ncbi:MAG: leucine-rich repeat domain-containing protein [Clostridia bacterium]|nr:leucine-rich repeat domain-containing protein [Clostridia bacterium]